MHERILLIKIRVDWAYIFMEKKRTRNVRTAWLSRSSLRWRRRLHVSKTCRWLTPYYTLGSMKISKTEELLGQWLSNHFSASSQRLGG